MLTSSRSRAHPRVLAALILGAFLLLAGCQTPDLKPFATASAAVTAGITQGGDLALQQIAREPALVDGEVVPPDAPNHPVVALAAEWDLRRQAADAILVYSASLAAIGDAATNRKANATALLGSVKQLASSVPGVSLGSSAAGNLLISGASGVVEIKAWRNMAEAVKNADGAIAVIAEAIRKDLASMANLHAGHHKTQIVLVRTAPEFRQLNRVHEALRTHRTAKRAAIASTPADGAVGDELARIDALFSGVERDLAPSLAAIARHRAALTDGARFYTSAIRAVEAWATTHRDLAQAFANKRTPNIALLLARAQEIQVQLQDLKSASRQPITP